MKKRVTGIFLVVLSGLISLSNIVITGSVVGKAQGNYFSFVSILIFLVGSFLILESLKRLEELADEKILVPSKAAERLNEVYGEGNILVLDTSYIGSWSRIQIGDLLRGIGNKYSSIVIPASVFSELGRSSKVRGHIDALLGDGRVDEPSKDFAGYREIARTYLEKSGKKLHRDEITSIMGGEKTATRRESAELIKTVRKIMENLGRSGKELSEDNIVYELDRHYEVSETDVDVLATALYEAKANPDRQIIVGEKDKDFEYAIDLLKNGGQGLKPHKLGKQINYRTPYKVSA